jgi:hypothetical protein
MSYILDLEKIIQTKDLPACIRRAAKELRYGGYMTAGEFFEKLEDSEVHELADHVENIHTDNFREFTVTTEDMQKSLYAMSLLCFILALGEGEPSLDPDQVSEMLKGLTALVLVESLHRKSLVQVFRENYSILDGKKVIAKKID